MTGLYIKAGLVAAVVMATGIFVFQSHAQEPKLGDVSDGNRSVPVHLIDLYDEEGSVIKQDDEPLMPFSPKQTCLPCHDYHKISSGWHFNAANPDVPPGRRGQSWIFVDQQTATQIPLSYRHWPGTYRPEQVGLTPFEFVQAFGRHMPGGGVGGEENFESTEFLFRWMVSGKLEINCLSCHDAEAAHDHAEYATQIARQNFRWAAAAASGIAWVRGSAKDMPDNYDIYFGSLLDNPNMMPPTISYDKTRFNAKGKVFFDIVRKVPNQRCYFCHSTKYLDEANTERWEVDEDVHLVAGMVCVDCHREGLDHATVRAYDGEPLVLENPSVATLTCKRCHLGDEAQSIPRGRGGRFGAPQPEHAGIPPVHFERLTCTTCHSGPWPTKKAYRIKTSRAHGLGTHGVNRSGGALPHILSPVFVKQGDGKIAPHKLFWPAFWGRLTGKKVSPIALENVRSIAASIIQKDTLRTGDWPTVTGEQIAKVLRLLTAQESTEGLPVYTSGGKLFRLDDTGKLYEQEHPVAQPYSWAFAHDVRPAAQSLGVRGCSDCHATDASFYFSEIDVDSPLASEPNSIKRMVDFQGLNAFYARAFAMSFFFRPWLKAIICVSCVILTAVLMLYGFKGLDRILKALAGEESET